MHHKTKFACSLVLFASLKGILIFTAVARLGHRVLVPPISAARSAVVNQLSRSYSARAAVWPDTPIRVVKQWKEVKTST